MNIPNIPTDNLYKFLSLSGVLLFIVAMVIPEIRRQAINDDIVNINGDIEMFEFEIKLVEDERNNLKRRLKYLDEKCNCGIVSEISDSLIVHYTITSGSKELIALSKEADSLIILYRENSEKLVKMSINIKTKNELLFNKTESLDILYAASLFTGFLGIIMMLLGFISWYELTQKYQDKIAREKVKAITKYIFCQSCGVRLTNDEYYITLPEPKKRQTKYCSYCYRDGKFIEPDLTFEEMKLKIEKRCEELKFNKFQTKVVIKHAKKLDRWAKRYKW